MGSRARTDAGVRLAAVVLLWSSLLVVCYWWSAGGGFRDRSTSLMSLGRLTGLLASDLLLVQVLLMARLPFLEHAFGSDALARHHRVVGFTSFNLMVAHIVTITWGYAAGRALQIPATFCTLTTQYSGVLLAVGGTACLVMVVVTSMRAARARLRYESWHLLHLYAYLGVGLALPHQLWTGSELLASRAATAYWWTVWAVTAGAVLVWRVALPLWRSARHQLRVTSVLPEGYGVMSVELTGRRLDRLPAEAGQFFHWRFLAGPGWTRSHPYSLSAAPDGHSLRITVKASGDGSSLVSALPPGTRALIEGPYGRLSPRATTRRRVALIGAGVGITPLRALAEGLPYAPGEAVVLHRFTTEPLFDAEFAALARARGLQVLNLPGRRRSPESWLGDGVGAADDLTALTYWVPDVVDRDVYVCGPELWTAAVRRTLLAAGLPPEQLHVESFGW